MEGKGISFLGRKVSKKKKMCAVVLFLSLKVFEMTIFTHLEPQGRALAVSAQFGRKIQTLACNLNWGSVD